MSKQKALALMGGSIALALWVLGSVLLQHTPTNAQGGVTNFDTIVASGDVLVGDDLTVSGEMNLAGTLDVAAEIESNSLLSDGSLDVGGDTQLAGDLTVGAALYLTEQTGITLTTGGTLTPTGSFQPIRAAGTIAFGAIGSCVAGTAGSFLVIENEVNQTINITDSTTLRLTANYAMAQFDTLTLVCDGATWVELARANN